ncbi:4a-hydroxytetrahydrobiopterin dehydratase [Pelagibacteraceae bacterium]|nr:4a-hydroxytetrahydrobiopterin dehydratase [Pelagibacteraceae bacterium]
MSLDLKNKKCQACTGKTPKFNPNQISEYLSNLDNWSVNEEQKMIFKKFNFKNFNQALNFVNKVGGLADKEGHHPDISIGWGYTLIMLHTHAINGLSLNDFILAAKIDVIN